MWKKRLFDEISSNYNSNDYTDNKRSRLSSEHFSCPQCSQSLATTKNGLDCVACGVNIPLVCQKELSPHGIRNMINSAKQQHCRCPTGNSKVISSNLGLPDGNDVFLIWTCEGCGKLEILL